MANKKLKTYLIGLIFDSRGFLGSLIMNPSLKIRNSNWRTQYGGRKCKYFFDRDDIWYWVVFGVAKYESQFKIKNGRSNMADDNVKNYLVGLKMSYLKDLGSLITNLS